MSFDGARARVAGATGLAGGGTTAGEVDAAIAAAVAALSIPTSLADLTGDVDTTTDVPVTGDLFQFDGTNWVPYTPVGTTVRTQLGPAPAGGAGTPVAAGVLINGFWEFSGTIKRWTILNDVSGTISYVLKTGATHPAGTTILTATATGATSATGTVTLAVTAGQYFQISIPSTATSVTLASLTLGIDRTVGP